MALNPWQERFEAVFLYSPEKPFPVFSVIAMCFTAMLEKRSAMQETFAADPAHHRWTCYLGGAHSSEKELVPLLVVRADFRDVPEP